MPEKKTTKRAQKAAQKGKAPSTQAGEYVREEMHHVRERKHGAKNSKQAIAIGLSKARKAGVKVASPKKGRSSAATRKKAASDRAKSQSRTRAKHAAKRSTSHRTGSRQSRRAA
jgi:hypothetical protein